MKTQKMKTSYVLPLMVLGLLMVGTTASSQGIIDGFYNPKGNISLTASYTGTSYDEFYVGTEKVGPVPAHNEITQDIISLYAKMGLTDKLTLILNAPYISAKGEGNPDPISGNTKESGLQDLGVAAKYRAFGTTFTGGKIDGITALGFSIPMGYESNSILSIGNGAFSTNLHVGGHLQLDQGFFTTLVAGYSFKGKAADSFNVNGGNDYDVPNAFLAMAKVGYASSKFYAELWADHQGTSSDGVDIMGPGFAGNFPETRVNYTRMGISAYVPLTKAVGVSGGYGTVLSGRNIGDTNYFNAGITLSFNTLSKSAM